MSTFASTTYGGLRRPEVIAIRVAEARRLTDEAFAALEGDTPNVREFADRLSLASQAADCAYCEAR